MSNELVVSDGLPAGGDSGSAGGYEGSNLAPVVTGDMRSRKAYIEEVRDTDFDRYEREGLGREYLAILRSELGEGRATDPMPVETSRGVLQETPEGARLVVDWERMGGFKRQLEHVQGVVGRLVQDLGDDREQRAFMERFDRTFPEPVRYAIYRQLSLGPASFATPVSDKEVTAFAVGDPGKALVAEWGKHAGEAIAKIWQRVENLKAAIGPDEMEVFKGWFDDLGARRQGRILKFIAEGK